MIGTSNKLSIPQFLIVIASITLAALINIGHVQADAGNQPIMQESSKSFADAVSGIKGVITDSGMSIIFEANHQNMIAMVGGSTTPSLTIGFARPQLGKTLLDAEPLASMEMPMRIAIRELSDGKVFLIHYQPSSLFANYNNPKLDKLGKKMDQMINKIIQAGL